MSSGRHTPPDDDSFVTSLLQHVGAAVALVLVVAAGFWAIGQVEGGDDDVGVVAQDPPTDQTNDPATPTESAPGSPEPSPTETTPSPQPTPEPSPEPTETATSTDRVDPAEVSIQVLDAVLDDGGAAAQATADALEGDGYDVVVVNKAFRTYDATTVFYTEGHEAEANQLATEYGFARVEPKPDNLSGSVDVHLVVGQDRA